MSAQLTVTMKIIAGCLRLLSKERLTPHDNFRHQSQTPSHGTWSIINRDGKERETKMDLKTCQQCGKKFKPVLSRAKFCSHPCAIASRRLGPCIVEGCSKKGVGHGYCGMHLVRVKKYGDPAVVKTSKKHGQKWPVETAEYIAWKNMKQRVFNAERADYKRYGGRGITVYPEWIKSFQSFYDHIGPKPTPKHTLDRIDNERGYEPGNVRWVTQTIQARNTRSTVHVTVDKETKPLTQWVEESPARLPYGTVYGRLKRGWEPSRAIFTPRIRKSTRSLDWVTI